MSIIIHNEIGESDLITADGHTVDAYRYADEYVRRIRAAYPDATTSTEILRNTSGARGIFVDETREDCQDVDVIAVRDHCRHICEQVFEEL